MPRRKVQPSESPFATLEAELGGLDTQRVTEHKIQPQRQQLFERESTLGQQKTSRSTIPKLTAAPSAPLPKPAPQKKPIFEEISSQPVPLEDQAPAIDLLGGLSEDDERGPPVVRRRREREDDESSIASSYTYSTSSSLSGFMLHRDAPQRGDIDAKVDVYFDESHCGVPIKKQGRNDGVYLFGARIMKTKVNSRGEIVVTVGTREIPIDEFISKYQRTESIRLRGMASSATLITMLGAQSRGFSGMM